MGSPRPRRGRSRWLEALACAGALLLLGAGPRSGYETMTPQLRAMQDDDLSNPGMLAVAEGEALFAREGCAGCHTAEAMRGVAARYPALDRASQAPIDLSGRIAQCREKRQQRPPLPREGPAMLALTAFVAHQSRGLPLQPDPRLAEARRQGEALFRERRGQLNLSCAQCHDDNAGRRLAGSLIPEGHPNGYPLYRLEWQALGSLQRRLRNCLVGVRSEPFPPGAPDYVALEAYLVARARGLLVETPAIRP
ncbi:sulfur oxidation c-type cytochrome SoxA [Paracraurococcus ruber]|uniref:L-cysteine S-thiosulfotransferase subunit SoxA n=1 Tax=Paracraurococcus ruber TaxID=77675 RepID=A0ABS1CSZ5_9PROT|nr:sulfur oxidation c-type cytochrome SoxA [Paracraurococcus ruber]MBK1657490.1 sulfur oxidation c-type cytochrome SoxA [Paracraurococcus ruber]TDG30785.1 sulfur oxidation c-type cytochrome SoxA [Paracraurococcus ruber]